MYNEHSSLISLHKIVLDWFKTRVVERLTNHYMDVETLKNQKLFFYPPPPQCAKKIIILSVILLLLL